MSFCEKLKNNKGSAESAMFVLGIAIFATIVVFAMDIFGLTWQRYLVTRELSNVSRLYAIRAYDLYLEKDSVGSTDSIMMTPPNSELGMEMGESLKLLVSHGKLQEATLTILKDNVVMLKITSDGAGYTFEDYAVYDVFKLIDYGNRLDAKIDVKYVSSKILGIANQEMETSEYRVTNKFAFEDYARNNTDIG